MTIPTKVRVVSLATTLDVLESEIAAGRAYDGLAAELVQIAREQTARLLSVEEPAGPPAPRRSATVLQFVHPNTSIGSSSTTSGSSI